MSKPQKTVADYMVIALSPVLIMALVGSLCFFLIEIFYRGHMVGSVRWVMFWYVIAVVLISRIAIENSTEYAAVYGLGLALATWIYLVRTQPAYLLGIVLLAVVWFCADRLVRDCTFIDEDQDSSGQGLLQKIKKIPKTVPKPGAKAAKFLPARSLGRWVIYFSLAALPLFGLGQMLLPGTAQGLRHQAFLLLTLYLAAALGLLITTSFLGLRRYLRQRYLKMPAAVAFGWLKFGVSVAALVLAGAVFLPRPGAGEAWMSLRYQIDYQLRRASQYASRANPHGQGEGRAGEDSGKSDNQDNGGSDAGSQDTTGQNPNADGGAKKVPGKGKPGEMPNPPKPIPNLTGSFGKTYVLLRDLIFLIAAVLVGGWVIRRRHLLWEMARSFVAALVQFLKNLFDFMPAYKPARKAEGSPLMARRRFFADYKNPFFTDKNDAWPPEQILIYTYEAVQVWVKEQGIELQPEQTAREFCGQLSERFPSFNPSWDMLAYLYAHAAYGRQLPANYDLEPIKELWRNLAVDPRLAAKASMA